uniref:Inner membrane protein n=1 Tax=Steinernema glaseri TaxID=37863 RepID=A0A1I7Z2Z5_9BILA
MEADQIPTLRAEDGHVARLSIKLNNLYNRYKRWILASLAALAIVGIHVYLGFAIAHNFKTAIPAIVILVMLYFFTAYCYLIKPFSKRISSTVRPYTERVESIWNYEIINVPVLKTSMSTTRFKYLVLNLAN